MQRRIHVVLADPAHRMPHPFNPQLDFPAGGQSVDPEDPVWMQLLADGSLVERAAAEFEPEPDFKPGAKKRKETT